MEVVKRRVALSPVPVIQPSATKHSSDEVNVFISREFSMVEVDTCKSGPFRQLPSSKVA